MRSKSVGLGVLSVLALLLLASGAMAADISNGGLENGTLNGWTTSGDAAVVQQGSDPFVGIAKVFEGKFAARIGDENAGYWAWYSPKPGDVAGDPMISSISQKFTVSYDTTKVALNFNYAVAAEGYHSSSEAAWFKITVRDVTSNSIIKQISNSAATDGGVPPGWINSGVVDRHNNEGDDPLPYWLYYQWQPVSIDISSAKGHQIELTFMVSDCYANYHTAYGYIDNLNLGQGPVITALTPNEGKIDTTVQIKGKNFGARQGTGFVTFSGVKATSITSWADTLIKARVPKKAVTGNVLVFTAEGKSNGVLFTVPPEPAKITGNVNDGHGNNLEGTTVELYKKKAGKLYLKAKAYTDNGGNYNMKYALEKAAYTIRVTLKTKDGKLIGKKGATAAAAKTIWADKDFNSDPVTNETPVRVDVNFGNKAEINNSSITKDDLDNCASIWYYVYKNYALARSIGYPLSFNCPVIMFEKWKANGSDARSGAYFSRDDKSIHLGEFLCDDSAAPNPPPWDFKKNRESHEFGHALMYSYLGQKWVALRSVGNHAGYANDNTGDSLSEGWAEFWTFYLVRNTDINSPLYEYDEWGDIINNRVQAWDPVNTFSPTVAVAKYPQEELAACGTLYDIYNPNGSIKMSVNSLVNSVVAANGAGNGATVTGVSTQVRARTANTAAVTPAFISHGFFNDANGNWTFDGNETVGAGNGAAFSIYVPQSNAALNINARAVRNQRPYEPNSFIKVNLASSSGVNSESKVNVAVHYTDPDYEIWDYNYDTTVTGNTGLVYLPLPANARAVVTTKGPSGRQSIDRMTVSYSDYYNGRLNTRAGAFTQKTFRVAGLSRPARPVFLLPRVNAKVKGKILIKTRCAGNPNWVELWIDKRKKTTKNVYPFNFNVNTRSLKNGKHILTIKSHNRAGYTVVKRAIFVVNPRRT